MERLKETTKIITKAGKFYQPWMYIKPGLSRKLY
jgi:hypothetical protein